MSDRLRGLLDAILASDRSDGPILAEQVELLWWDVECENASLRNDLRKAETKIRMKNAEIRDLKGQVAKLNKMKFGTSADQNPAKGKAKMDSNSDDTSGSGRLSSDPKKKRDDPQNEGKAEKRTLAPRNRNGRGQRVFPKHLERREIYMGTPDKMCPCGCGGSIRGYDVNETLEVIPARHYVAVRQYPRYRCRVKDKVVGTNFLPRVFPQTTMSNGVLANAVFMRFGAQLPWYRQENIFKSYGIDLNRSTLMKWSNRVATQALLPIYELLKLEVQQNSARLFMDETTVPMLAPGTGKTKTSYLFAVHRDDRSFGGNKPPVVLYYPSKTRAMYKIHEILDGVSAIVQTDAYAGYGQLGRKGTIVEGIVSPKCWAHARRNFSDEFEFNGTADATAVIGLISELYAEEAKIRGKPPLVREAHRRRYSAPILTRLKVFLDECSGRHLTKNRMAKTINYAQNHWPELVLFVENGRIDLDTNPVERMFKPSILLRKNVLFMGSDEGAEAWGIHSSIVETCKLNGVNVEPYLNWVLDEIAAKLPRSEYDKLLPWNAPAEFKI